MPEHVRPTVKTELRLVDYEEVFRNQLKMYLDALALVAAERVESSSGR